MFRQLSITSVALNYGGRDGPIAYELIPKTKPIMYEFERSNKMNNTPHVTFHLCYFSVGEPGGDPLRGSVGKPIAQKTIRVDKEWVGRHVQSFLTPARLY